MSAESLRERHPTGSVKSRARITHAELVRDPFNAVFFFMLLVYRPLFENGLLRKFNTAGFPH